MNHGTFRKPLALAVGAAIAGSLATAAGKCGADMKGGEAEGGDKKEGEKS